MTVRENNTKERRRSAQQVANQPGPTVSPLPPVIVLPPHAIPFTAALCPLTSIAGVPGFLVSNICTSAESACTTDTYVGAVGEKASLKSGEGKAVEEDEEEEVILGEVGEVPLGFDLEVEEEEEGEG